MKNSPKSPNKGLLVLLIVALFTVAGLVFSRAVDFSQFMIALTGSLTDVNRYTLSTASALPASSANRAVLTSTLTVTATPANARYEVKNAMSGSVVIPEHSGTGPMVLAAGDYRVVFKPLAGYDTPAEVSTSITLRIPARVNVSYVPWPSCVASDWSCTVFSECNPTTRQHTRICVMNNPHCSSAEAVQPSLSEACTPCGGKKKC